MICPFCQAEGQTSRVTVGLTSSTLMGSGPDYYDEQGNFVRAPDPNWHTTSYACSRGHGFTIRRREGDPDEVRLISRPEPRADPHGGETP